MYLNQTYIDYAGASRDDIAADPMASSIRMTSEALGAGWDDAVDTAAPFSMDWRIRRRDGAYRWHAGTDVPVRRQSAAVTSWVCSAVDIDDRRRTEDALADEPARTEPATGRDGGAVLRRRLSAIAIAEDPSVPGIRANAQFGRMLRAPEGETNISLTPGTGGALAWYRVQRHGIDVPAGDLPIAACGAHREPVLGEHLDVVFDDGDTITIFGGAMPLRDESGAVRGVISAWVDITERERYRDEQRILVDLGDALNAALEYEETLRAALCFSRALVRRLVRHLRAGRRRPHRASRGGQRLRRTPLTAALYASVDAAPSWARRAFERGEQSLYDEIPRASRTDHE